MSPRAINGPTVKALRCARGLRQVDLAELIECNQPYVANIEVGRKQPSFDTALRLAHALGVPFEAISYPVRDAADAPVSAA